MRKVGKVEKVGKVGKVTGHAGSSDSESLETVKTAGTCSTFPVFPPHPENDRLERIRALLPGAWCMGRELDAPEPAEPDDDDHDDGTEMKAASGVGLSAKSRRSLSGPAPEPFISQSRIDVHEPRSGEP